MDDTQTDEALKLIDELAGDGKYVNTEQLARAVFDANRAAGRPALLNQNAGPWFGLERVLRELEDRNLIDIDPGVAEFVPRGSPAPVARHFFVGLTDPGKARLTGST